MGIKWNAHWYFNKYHDNYCYCDNFIIFQFIFHILHIDWYLAECTLCFKNFFAILDKKKNDKVNGIHKKVKTLASSFQIKDEDL